MKTKISIVLITCLVFMSQNSCKKEKVQAPNVEVENDTCFCEPLPKPGIMFGDPSLYNSFSDDFTKLLEVNPNDENEIVYSEGVYPNVKLVFYNKSDQTKNIIYNDNITNKISWSVKDWILFQRFSDRSVFKIKSSGDSLTQLTFGDTYHFGTWNYTGERFLVHDKKTSHTRTMIMDENGQITDSVKLWDHTSGTWNHPFYYLGSHSTEIIVLNVENKTIRKKIDFPVGSDIRVLGWVSLDEFWYLNGNKLFRYHLPTNKTKLLKCECYKSFIALSSNKEFSTLVGVKSEGTAWPNYITHYTSKINVVDGNANVLEEIIP